MAIDCEVEGDHYLLQGNVLNLYGSSYERVVIRAGEPVSITFWQESLTIEEFVGGINFPSDQLVSFHLGLSPSLNEAIGRPRLGEVNVGKLVADGQIGWLSLGVQSCRVSVGSVNFGPYCDLRVSVESDAMLVMPCERPATVDLKHHDSVVEFVDTDPRVELTSAVPGSVLRRGQVIGIGDEVIGVTLEEVQPVAHRVLASIGPTPPQIFSYTPSLDLEKLTRLELDGIDSGYGLKWFDAHNRLMQERCPRPDLVANSRWLVWNAERRDAGTPLFRRLMLYAMSLFGYGLRWAPPLLMWLFSGLVAVSVVTATSSQLAVASNLNFGAVKTAFTAYVEALLLPADVVDFSDQNQNRVLQFESRLIEVFCRLLATVSFGSLLLALRSQFRLLSAS